MSSTVTRPVPEPARPGYEWYPKEAGPEWSLLRRGGSTQCRWRHDGVRCPMPPTAWLNRGRRGHDQWWGYCRDHMFGRWEEEGRIVAWALRRTALESPWDVLRRVERYLAESIYHHGDHSFCNASTCILADVRGALARAEEPRP